MRSGDSPPAISKHTPVELNVLKKEKLIRYLRYGGGKNSHPGASTRSTSIYNVGPEYACSRAQPCTHPLS